MLVTLNDFLRVAGEGFEGEGIGSWRYIRSAAEGCGGEII
jgi:hypothetical protein